MEMAWKQFLACLESHFFLPQRPASEWLKTWEALPGAEQSSIQHWYQAFCEDIYQSRAGYPLKSPRHTPDLEDRLLEIAESASLITQATPKPSVPTLCLSHDIDYLRPTLQMTLKRLMSQRRFSAQMFQTDFLASIEALLALDSKVSGAAPASTLFIARKERAATLKNQLVQWLIDPSYRYDDALGHQFLKLLERYTPEIGIHGSFFSLSEQLFEQERQALESILRRPIRMARQHWLNLPGEDALERLQSGGITVDSTLGWNGQVGFRAGMARPFPLLLKNGETLWEMPMVLMDGPMFDDLKLSPQQVVTMAQGILSEVFARQGCVAINWHDRAAHQEYQWYDAYQEILHWAQEKGFRLSPIGKAIEERTGAPIDVGCQQHV
jgi:hypothetical protein